MIISNSVSVASRSSCGSLQNTHHHKTQIHRSISPHNKHRAVLMNLTLRNLNSSITQFDISIFTYLQHLERFTEAIRHLTRRHEWAKKDHSLWSSLSHPWAVHCSTWLFRGPLTEQVLLEPRVTEREGSFPSYVRDGISQIDKMT